MTTATATPKLTLAEQAAAAEHKRIVNSLEVYRKLAQTAAAGDTLTADQFGRVVAALEFLRLPPICLERDVKAIQQFNAATSAIESLEARRPQVEAEARELRDRIAEMKKQLPLLESEHARKTRLFDGVAISNLQRCEELKSLHPQVLCAVELATELAMKRRSFTYATPPTQTHPR